MATRRDVLVAAAASMGASVAARAASRSFDPASTDQAFEVLLRLIGSLSPRTVYENYSGVIFAHTPGEPAAPILRFRGVNKTVWTSLPDGAMRSRRYDMMTIQDYASRSSITRFRNPLTGDELDVPIIAFGPETLDHSLELMRQGKRALYAAANWQESGPNLLHGYEVAFGYPHPLQPKDWPKGSPGERGFSTIAISHEAPKAELLDRKASSVRAVRSWINVASWSPWMNMGQRPGALIWRGRGIKGVAIDEIPAGLRSEIERAAPGFFESSEPWAERRDEFRQYMQANRPEPAA